MRPDNERSRPGQEAASTKLLRTPHSIAALPAPPKLGTAGSSVLTRAKNTTKAAIKPVMVDAPAHVDDPGPSEPDRWDEVEATTPDKPIEPVPAAPPARLDVVTADTVVRRRVVYVWGQRIPLGAVTVMPGEEGIGKTTVGARIKADITRGNLPGEFQGTPRDVIVLAAEDGIEDVFVPRLAEAGADLARVHIIRGRIGTDNGSSDVIVPRDLGLLGDLVQEKRAALVWIDSLVTTLPDDMKSIAYKDTAKVLRALGEWAERHRVAVVAPWHLNKATGSDTAVRMMDSRAFRTAVRSVLLVVPDPDAEDGVTQGIVALDKANAGTLAVPALRYRIRSAEYEVTESDPTTGRTRVVPASCGVADWVGEVTGDGRAIARNALAPVIERADGAQDWLRDHLAEVVETPRKDVIEAARGMFSESSIKRAARAIGVHSRDETGQDPTTGRPYRRAVWSLPQSGHQSVHPSPTDRTDPTGEGYIDPIDPITAGHVQSGQSGQSGLGGPNGRSGDPTGKPSLCACGNIAERDSAACWRYAA